MNRFYGPQPRNRPFSTIRFPNADTNGILVLCLNSSMIQLSLGQKRGSVHVCMCGPAHAFGYEGACVSGGVILAQLNAQFKAHLTAGM